MFDQYKTVVIAVSLDKEALPHFHKLKNSALFKGVHLHFVHIFEVRHYVDGLTYYSFPNQEQYTTIEKEVYQVFDNLEKDLFPSGDPASVTKKCLFDGSPKKALAEYSQEVGADLIVMATREKHGIKGFFTSSFAEHMIKTSPCDTLVLKPEGK